MEKMLWREKLQDCTLIPSSEHSAKRRDFTLIATAWNTAARSRHPSVRATLGSWKELDGERQLRENTEAARGRYR
eukprot:5250440-Pleurochrysis_carterae.AAC.1